MLLEMLLNYLGAAAPGAPAVTKWSVPAAPGSGEPLPSSQLLPGSAAGTVAVQVLPGQFAQRLGTV